MEPRQRARAHRRLRGSAPGRAPSSGCGGRRAQRCRPWTATTGAGCGCCTPAAPAQTRGPTSGTLCSSPSRASSSGATWRSTSVPGAGAPTDTTGTAATTAWCCTSSCGRRAGAARRRWRWERACPRWRCTRCCSRPWAAAGVGVPPSRASLRRPSGPRRRRRATKDVGAALDRAGDARFNAKAASFRARLRQGGGESGWAAQLLYQAVMEALGYSRNREPFLALAEGLPLARLERLGRGAGGPPRDADRGAAGGGRPAVGGAPARGRPHR